MLQKEVNAIQALGVAGQISKARDSFFNTISGVCVDDKVEVGYFVQAGDNEGEVKGVKGAAVSGAILGVVIFDNFADGASDSAVKASGASVTILNEGSVFIETDKTAKAGQYVGVSTTDGNLAFGDSTTITGAKYTGFVVVKGNGADERGVIEISTAGAR